MKLPVAAVVLTLAALSMAGCSDNRDEPAPCATWLAHDGTWREPADADPVDDDPCDREVDHKTPKKPTPKKTSSGGGIGGKTKRF